MARIETARTRAEDLLQNLKKKAKELLEAEEGAVKTARAFIEEKGFHSADVQGKLEELAGRIKATRLWERAGMNGALAALIDYRDEVERKVEDSRQRLMYALSLVSQSELRDLTRQVTALHKKVSDLSKKLEN